MIGPRVGLKAGERFGMAVGTGSDELAPDSSGTPQTTLTVAIADSADPVISAVNFDYTVVVTNTGANSATNVVATIVLDSALTYVSSSGSGWTISTASLPTITCTRATGAAGALPTITITVTSGSSTHTNSTTADADSDNSPAATQDTETTVCNLVTKDATAGIRFPANTTEWTNFLAYIGLSGSINAPGSLWNCQEASGNLADSGAGGVTLTAAGTPNYQQTVSGYTRKGVKMDASSTDGFGAAAGVGPNPATGSVRWLWFTTISALANSRQVCTAGGAAAATEMVAKSVATTAVLQGKCATNVAATASANTGNGITSILYDRTNTIARVYYLAEKASPTYDAGVTDGNKGIGAGILTAADAAYVYGCVWSGANAEFSEANYKSLLQAMGLTIGW